MLVALENRAYVAEIGKEKMEVKTLSNGCCYHWFVSYL